MRTSLIAAALAAFAGSSALAADLVVPAVQPLPPEFSWTAFYAGGNLGGFWSNSSTVIGGGQIGYNWQYRWLVVGGETDLQGMQLRCSGLATNPFGNSIIANASVDYLGTLRSGSGSRMADGSPLRPGGSLTRPSTTAVRASPALRAPTPGRTARPDTRSAAASNGPSWTAGALKRNTFTRSLAAKPISTRRPRLPSGSPMATPATRVQLSLLRALAGSLALPPHNGAAKRAA